MTPFLSLYFGYCCGCGVGSSFGMVLCFLMFCGGDFVWFVMFLVCFCLGCLLGRVFVVFGSLGYVMLTVFFFSCVFCFGSFLYFVFGPAGSVFCCSVFLCVFLGVIY